MNFSKSELLLIKKVLKNNMSIPFTEYGSIMNKIDNHFQEGRRCIKCNKLFVDEKYFKCVMENSPYPTQHFVCFKCFEDYILTIAG